MRLTEDSKTTLSQLSFDSFFYRDHVTLRKYPFENLKQSATLRRQITEESDKEKWRELQQSQMVELIDYIDLWKNIKSNRNNILVYGNKKNYPDTLSTQRKLTWNLDQEEENSQNDLKEFEIERAQTQDEPLDSKNQPKADSNKIKTDRKTISNQNLSKQAMNSQSVGKLKRKMNFQIYKLNKELLRDYLSENREYKVNYNSLIKNEDNLKSKLKKITTLIDVLKKEQTEKQNILQRLSQDAQINLELKQKLIQHDEKNSNSMESSDQRVKKVNRLHTEANETRDNSLSKGQISLQKLKQTCKLIDHADDDGVKRKNPTVPLFKKKALPNFFRREQCSQNVQKMFKKEWQKIQEEIKLKYRRQAEYSLNHSKKKKNEALFK